MAKNKTKLSDVDIKLAEDMGRFFFDPLGFVMYAYEWGKGELEGFDGPFDWQRDFLIEWGNALRENPFDGVTPVPPIRMARTSGHGIGKSALTGWTVDFIMSTRPYCRGTITANTSAQLETKTWAEIAKWTKRCITSHWFEVRTGRGSMKMYRKGMPEDWFCSAQTCREENSEAFAGQHAVTSTSFYIFDEASAVPDKINEVSEGGLTDGEPMKFAYGNPTRNTGWFKQCFHKNRHLWNTARIDSREVPISNKPLIDEWIRTYGDDSDFVRVRVKGQFPRASVGQFIPSDIVEEAAGKVLHPTVYESSPKIMGIDIALQGDDQSVIVYRQGPAMYGLKKFREADALKLSGIIAQEITDNKPDAVFLDLGNIGIVVQQNLIRWGHNVTGIWFGGKSTLQQCKNKRTDMYWRYRDWLATMAVSIPDDQELIDDSTGPEYYTDENGVVLLESKKDMKKRGLASTDCSDAAVLTHAAPVERRSQTLEDMRHSGNRNRVRNDYDPLRHRRKG